MYRQVVIRKGKERALINRHPWVFFKSLAWLPEYDNGEIVEVISSAGEILGYGFFSPASRIVCRIFDFTGTKHESLPPEYFKDKIFKALELRRSLIDTTVTDCFRMVNAEGDYFPGLVIDVYGSTAVIQLLIKGVERMLDTIVAALDESGFTDICLKNPGLHQAEDVSVKFAWIKGGGSRLIVRENSLKFVADPEAGQKTGFFLDQRENRQMVRDMSMGRTVLNAFSYTGGFSVYALAGGASLVHSVDVSSPALSLLDENIRLNFGERADHNSFCRDCFDYLRTMQDDFYDLIVLDPPAFVKSAVSLEKGARGYKDINLQAMKKIRGNSLIFTFSCSQHISTELFRKIVFSAAADSKRRVRVIRQLQGSCDHPFDIYHPEGEYLKGLLLHVE
ncbi:MAG: class I SAM-dependent rRNA methyltransferase [Spirochaetes bacterium]|nr:class I SAM-dependent rRNA methyltransferase [Spirochaetota bacterium]